jgi:hypothetical protein
VVECPEFKLLLYQKKKKKARGDFKVEVGKELALKRSMRKGKNNSRWSKQHVQKPQERKGLHAR